MLGTTLHHNHHAFPRALSPAIDGDWDPMNAVYFILEKVGAISSPCTPAAHGVELKRFDTTDLVELRQSEAVTWDLSRRRKKYPGTSGTTQQIPLDGRFEAHTSHSVQSSE